MKFRPSAKKHLPQKKHLFPPKKSIIYPNSAKLFRTSVIVSLLSFFSLKSTNIQMALWVESKSEMMRLEFYNLV